MLKCKITKKRENGDNIRKMIGKGGGEGVQEVSWPETKEA